MPAVNAELNLTLKRLEPADKVRGLSLGEEFTPLKTFLQKNALDYERNSLSRTYALFNEGGQVRGYISIICGEVVIDADVLLHHEEPLRFPYKHFPAIKIARLAIDKRLQKQNLGIALVEFALGVGKDLICPHVGCRFAVVDAKQASVSFYERCGFTLIDTQENRGRDAPVMFIDLNKV